MTSLLINSGSLDFMETTSAPGKLYEAVSCLLQLCFFLSVLVVSIKKGDLNARHTVAGR